MLVNEVLTALVQHWPVVLVTVTASFLLSNKFWKGLNKYPGPTAAGYSNWWRLWDVNKRNHHWTTLALHREHGDIVRLGPNVLSFADPKAIKQIYGLNKGITKVGICYGYLYMSANPYSLIFTRYKARLRTANPCFPSSPPQTKTSMPSIDDV